MRFASRPGCGAARLLCPPRRGRPDLAAITVTGTSEVAAGGAAQAITRTARPLQAAFTAGGGRRLFDVEMATACVTDAPDVVLAPALKDVALAPGQSARIEVNVARRAGYSGTVSLGLLLRHLNVTVANPLPPGVTVVENQSKSLLEREGDEGVDHAAGGAERGACGAAAARRPRPGAAQLCRQADLRRRARVPHRQSEDATIGKGQEGSDGNDARRARACTDAARCRSGGERC